MKHSLSLVWIACLLIAVGCNGPKNAAPEDAMGALTLKTYDPVSVFVMEEHHPAAARFSVIDMHSHAYRNDEAGIRQWAKTLDENNIERELRLHGIIDGGRSLTAINNLPSSNIVNGHNRVR